MCTDTEGGKEEEEEGEEASFEKAGKRGRGRGNPRCLR